MRTTIRFLGGAGSVTGSNFLVQSEDPAGKAGILVDCGLFQGQHSCENENWSAFSFDPKSISHLIVTHAHIDHIGRIPRLVREGFTGRIISTAATKSIAGPLLRDALELLTSEARRCNTSALYEESDIEKAMTLWDTAAYHQPLELTDGYTLEFINSGHILGSAMARFSRGGKSLVFTGDLGGGNSPLLPKTEDPANVDYLVMESVYGNRVRSPLEHRREALEDVIEDTYARGGTLLIPAFSTERTQDLLFEIRTLMVEKRVPSMPVFVDSPLAHEVTRSFLQHPEFFNDEMRGRIEKGENLFDFPEMECTESADASRAIADRKGPNIIIAGSGMSNGGRVIGHEQRLLPDERSTVLVVGYQAAGSFGRKLIEGAKTMTMRGQSVLVRCRVESIYGYSAHMDGEQLLEFVNKAAASLTEVFVVMGEPASSSFLSQRIRDFLGVKATTPMAGERASVEL